MKKKKVLPAPSAMVMTAMSYESGSKQAFVSSNVAGGSGRAVKGRFGNENGITGKGGISGKECRGSGFSIRGRGVMKRSVSRSAMFCTRYTHSRQLLRSLWCRR